MNHKSIAKYFIIMLMASWSVGKIQNQVNAADEFIELFNGQDLSAWVEEGTEGAFEIKEGSIYSNGKSPYPSRLRTEQKYENFVLQFDYQTEGWYEGGVIIHAPEHGPDSTLGLKLHLRHDRHEYGKRSPGALYDVATPLEIANNRSGEWNHCQIEYNWPHLLVTLNDTKIHDINMENDPNFASRLRQGYIAIQNLGCRAYFKNIQINPLPASDQWIDLFADGLDEFTYTGDTEWSLEGNLLTGVGGDGFAVTGQSFESPYEFQVWVKTIVNGNGGINFHWNDESRGTEIQCFNAASSTNPTGSLYHVEPATKVVSQDEEWYLIHMITNENHAKIYVNGELVTKTSNLSGPYHGKLGFQQHTQGATVWYKDARIKQK